MAVKGEAREEETERAGEVMAGHTKGPWHLVGGQVFSDTHMVDLIADVIGGSGRQFIDDDTNAECLANARLIAAAPDLLEAMEDALQGLLAAFPHASRIRDILQPKIDRARAAIAKATEQPPVPSS